MQEIMIKPGLLDFCVRVIKMIDENYARVPTTTSVPTAALKHLTSGTAHSD